MRMNHICCKEDMNIVLILVSVLLNSVTQLLMRKGMLAVGEVRLSNLFQMVGPMLANMWLSMLCYVVSFVLWMVGAVEDGGDLRLPVPERRLCRGRCLRVLSLRREAQPGPSAGHRRDLFGSVFDIKELTYKMYKPVN